MQTILLSEPRVISTISRFSIGLNQCFKEIMTLYIFGKLYLYYTN